MNYPLISDYVSSILSAEDNFKKLTHLRPILDEEGQPIMSSGNFAVVFKMKDEQTGKLYAVKCFLKEQEGRAESYKLIEEELEFVSSNYLTPIRYMEDELFVDSNNTKDTEFPILLMDWIEGITLDKYIRTHLGYAYGLAMLTYRFSKLASWLLAQPFAHGELKSDNILIKEDGSLVLVDYDGMYVPAMKGQKAREIGSPDFRHPKRTEDDFNEHIDDFAIASILLSLKAISLDPQLLKLYGDVDRLLFSQKDYLDLSISNVIDALRPLMEDDELNLLFSIFLLVHSKLELSIIPFRYLKIKKPTDNEVSFINVREKLDFSDANVQFEIGRRFIYGFGIPQNTNEAFKWFLLSAKQGNAKAQNNVGQCYRLGNGVDCDCSKAFDWYLKSAEQGNADAQFHLGSLYFHRKEIEQNYTEAFKWFKKSAQQKNLYAQCALGVCYQQGKGVEKDSSEATKWYLKSAEQGNASAQFNLANHYYMGNGIKQDYIKAAKWYINAAEQGHVDAQYKLGLCYEKGYGIEKNLHIALKWYLNAAQKGNNLSQFKVGQLFHYGIIVDRDFKEAKQWYLKSASLNNLQAALAIERLDYCMKAQVTDEDFINSIEDEYGCIYSSDGSRLLKAKTIANDQFERPMWSFDSDYLYFPYKKYIIKKGTKVICNNAFENCRRLESIVLPDSVKYIGEKAFNECCDIINVNIPNSVVGIGKYAFKKCTKLETINISTGMSVLQDCIFEGCSKLENITIPNSIKQIIGNPFALCNCTIINQSSSFAISNKGNLYTSDWRKLISYRSMDEEYTPLNSVKEFGDKSFAGCSFKKIIIPITVTSICNSIFYKGNIEEVIIHCSINSFDDFALFDCTINNILFLNNIVNDNEINKLLKPYKDYQMNGQSFYGNYVNVKKNNMTNIMLEHDCAWIV